MHDDGTPWQDLLSRRAFLRGLGAAAAIALSRPLSPVLAGWPVQSSYLVKRPDGTTVRVPGRVMALFQKAAIVWDRGVETMTLNSLYNGEGDLFGCFGPVAADTRSKPVTSSLFESLDRQVGRRSFAEFRTAENAAFFKASREEVYNLELLRSLEDIRRWFAPHGFALTPKVQQMARYYFDRGRIFFAALLSYEYRYKQGRVNVWTQPIQNRFRSDRIWFPVKSTTTGDGTHSFVSFDILTTGRVVDVPSMYKVASSGLVTVGGKRYNLTRLEAKLTMAQMEQGDLELKVQ